MTPVQIEYAWPVKELSQNHRRHWRHRHSAAKKWREDATLRTLVHRNNGLSDLYGKPLELFIEFYPPLRGGRMPDVQNVIGSCKSMIDGIQDAMGSDDGTWRIHWPDTHAEKVPYGKVVVKFWGEA